LLHKNSIYASKVVSRPTQSGEMQYVRAGEPKHFVTHFFSAVALLFGLESEIAYVRNIH
jgi:hypothetical protein